MEESKAPRILVIKLSALGDMVMAMAAFQAIRRAHPEAHITLLTTPPYRGLVEGSGCFDEIWAAKRPSRWRPWEEAGLARRLRGGAFTRIYDLQWSALTERLFRALGAAPPDWVGVAPGCAYFYPDRKAAKHIVERHKEALALAGIEVPERADFAYLKADLPAELSDSFALVVPGGSPRRQGKRWPVPRYLELCRRLAAEGLEPVLIGGPAEAQIIAALRQGCPEARHYQTDWALLAALARKARVAVGNDTGPQHLIAAVGCPTVVLFGSESDPLRIAPRGQVQVLRSERLSELTVEEVHQGVQELLRPPPGEAVHSG